jgi:hypothetical protein
MDFFAAVAHCVPLRDPTKAADRSQVATSAQGSESIPGPGRALLKVRDADALPRQTQGHPLESQIRSKLAAAPVSGHVITPPKRLSATQLSHLPIIATPSGQNGDRRQLKQRVKPTRNRHNAFNRHTWPVEHRQPLIFLHGYFNSRTLFYTITFTDQYSTN